MSKMDDILRGFVGKTANVCAHCGQPGCDGKCLTYTACYQQALAQYNNQQSFNGFLHQGQLDAMKLALIGAGQAPAPSKPTALPQEEIVCATGGIVGWREWRVQNFGDVLYSFNGEAWPARKPLRASCKSDSTASCRGEHCTCGLYSWKKQESLTFNEAPYNRLRGEVWMWGKVIEHELGYRAEYQYPKSFIDTGADARRLAAIYGVKLIGA